MFKELPQFVTAKFHWKIWLYAIPVRQLNFINILNLMKILLLLHVNLFFKLFFFKTGQVQIFRLV